MLHHSLSQFVKLYQRTIVDVLQKRLIVLFLLQVGQVHCSEVDCILSQLNMLQVFVKEEATERGKSIESMVSTIII